MAQKVMSCSAGCIDGEVTLVFADFSRKRLREVYICCPVCYPDKAVAVEPGIGEEPITTEQYYEYLKQDWQETDPV